MRITINPTLDMDKLVWLQRPSYDYRGPVIIFKGDDTAKNAEMQQQAFDQQLMQIFQAQYGRQTDVLNYLNNQLKPQISAGGQGYSPAELAAQRTGAKDTLTAEYANAQKGVNSAAVRAGGNALPSGVGAQLTGSLAASEAADQANAQNSITTANANLKNSNYWNAISALTGNAQIMNPLGYSTSATGGTNAVANASEAFTNSNQSQLLGALGGIAGGAATGFVTGGFSKGGIFNRGTSA